MHYRVGTRGSLLAISQTEYVIKQLEAAYPEDSFEIVTLKTTGDRNTSSMISSIGGKGIFVDTIENELLNGTIHFAVHSMKDMPDTPLEGLTFTKSWKREDPRDVLILREAKSLDELKTGARIATGSLRRIHQLKLLRPDIEIVPIRGNIDTRIRKLNEIDAEGNRLDGIVLAAAGMHRLNRKAEITQYLSIDEMLPAPGQGTLAIEVREDNYDLISKIDAFSDDVANNITRLERGFLKGIEATCHDLVAAYACYENGKYSLKAMFGLEDGSEIYRAEAIGENADEELITKVIDAIRREM